MSQMQFEGLARLTKTNKTMSRLFKDWEHANLYPWENTYRLGDCTPSWVSMSGYALQTQRQCPYNPDNHMAFTFARWARENGSELSDVFKRSVERVVQRYRDQPVKLNYA